jgi:hypothetical protein
MHRLGEHRSGLRECVRVTPSSDVLAGLVNEGTEAHHAARGALAHPFGSYPLGSYPFGSWAI